MGDSKDSTVRGGSAASAAAPSPIVEEVPPPIADPPPDSSERLLLAKRQEFFETFFKKGVEFTEELLAENERLRYQVLRLEDELNTSRSLSPDPHVRALAERIAQLEKERDTLVSRFHKAEEQNRDFQERYAEIEREHNNLANLYVASYQLHSTLELREVVQIVVEILINFIGAHTFALYLADDGTQTLQPLVSEGAPLTAFPTVPFDRGILGRVFSTGETHLDEASTPRPLTEVTPDGTSAHKWNPEHPIVAISLGIGTQVIGAIGIYRLFIQKPALLDVDFELLKLLTKHAGGAITAARLAAEVGPRRQVFAQFRDLLR
jgi:hypothetical protein